MQPSGDDVWSERDEPLSDHVHDAERRAMHAKELEPEEHSSAASRSGGAICGDDTEAEFRQSGF